MSEQQIFDIINAPAMRVGHMEHELKQEEDE